MSPRVTWIVDDANVPSDNDLPFEQYLRDSFAGMVARLRSSFSERIAAEDIVQEALIRAWQMAARGEEIRSLDPWMSAAATNLARSRWRSIHAEDRALQRLASVGRLGPAELGRLRARAGVAVVTTRAHETFGLAAVEAMAAGLPTVATARGALTDLADGVSLVPAGDPARLAEAITNARGNVAAGRRAHAAALRLVAPTAVAPKLAAVYAGL
jgi:DNA-directed RNA polymerase specialized sigma24 family protein